jgi:hypothetical protein
VREAQAAKAAAEKAARDAVRATEARAAHPTRSWAISRRDDSFGKIIADVADELAGGLAAPGAIRRCSGSRT